MKRLLIYIAAAGLMLYSCKPEEYTGPLDSPVGNWDGIRTEYYFDGSLVAETETCEYPAISFYKQGLCCIEGVKGAFPYTYDHSSGELLIDSRLWNVTTLTGAEMVMSYTEVALPLPDEPEAQEEGAEQPVEPEEPEEPEVPVTPEEPEVPTYEYNGMTITSDQTGYFYMKNGEPVYCRFFETTAEDGSKYIDFWYDSHTDHFIPLVVESKK